MSEKQRVVIVGAGFSRLQCGAHGSGILDPQPAPPRSSCFNSTDYFLYLPLMPQVSGGLVEPRHICASLPRHLRKARFILGTVEHIDPASRTVSWATPAGAPGQITYDRLILTAGSVNKLLPIPGVAEYAHGFRSIAESHLPPRSHHPPARAGCRRREDRAERQARCTFVVVGGGYTGDRGRLPRASLLTPPAWPGRCPA